MDRNTDKTKEVEKIEVPEGKMFIKVYAPYKNYFEGLADSISAANGTGDFDILPGHHKFLTLLSKCDIEIRTGGEELDKISISMGIMYVLADRVTVFLDV